MYIRTRWNCFLWYQKRTIQLHSKKKHQAKTSYLRDRVKMTRWIAVPICSDCDVVMPPDNEGDFVCPECEEYIESENSEE